MGTLLTIRNLSVTFGNFRAVDGINLTVEPGEVIGIVGESGSGKSVTMMALMGLIQEPGKVSSDKIIFDGQDLKKHSSANKRQIIGKDIAMIFQDPISALNPCFTVGFQIMEVLSTHLNLRGSALKKQTLLLMEQVEIPDAKSRLNAYPHQLSGGMCQRIAIAMAIACQPKLLIADEPTTALDVTIQSQIIDLLASLQKIHGMALIMITHDLALIAQIAHHIEMIYAGQIVEQGSLPHLFESPAHPYTAALLSSLPEHSQGRKRLATLPGTVPSYYDRPKGCLFAPRCQYAKDRCQQHVPLLEDNPFGKVRCYYPLTAKIQTRKKARK
ncbi:MAG: ABC transporter ATP-binding protein [Neisseriales bacterium]|nr:MAG: ABC transporter ATP-binding protein [Neisseriales bacterium]